MDFKINKKTRVKITVDDLRELRESHGYETIWQFRIEFEKESGLELTCRRFIESKRTFVYYFKVLDKNKYFLGKIKYGF